MPPRNRYRCYRCRHSRSLRQLRCRPQRRHCAMAVPPLPRANHRRCLSATCRRRSHQRPGRRRRCHPRRNLISRRCRHRSQLASPGLPAASLWSKRKAKAPTPTRPGPNRRLPRMPVPAELEARHSFISGGSHDRRKSHSNMRALSVSGVADEMRQVDAHFPEGARIFVLEILVENQIGIGWAMQPAVGLDLRLELSR